MTSAGVSQSGTLIKKVPSKLIEDQISGRSLADIHQKPEIVQFLNIADYSIHPQTDVPLDEPLFQPEPTVIQFSNYQPLDSQETLFSLRNKDKVSRRVKLIPPDSRLFTILKASRRTLNESDTKVAPGMNAEFIVKFIPEAKVDYSYDLMVVTEREKFIVPIRCLGQRAMIAFPDLVPFGVCPVKHITEKPVVIRNLGEKPTKWVLRQTSPFTCSKVEGYLEVGQVEQLVLSFAPQESRVFEEELQLCYDSLVAYIKIQGEARNDPNVFLSKSFMDLKRAYITLSSQDTVKIINKSEVPIEFEWRAFSGEAEEHEKKLKLNLQLSQEEAEERMLIEENLEFEEEVESLDSDDSYDELEEKTLKEKQLQRALADLERKYANIRKAVEDDLMLFQDDIFAIEPRSGKLWPNSELEITVKFCPQNALHYTCTAYCNVTCSEERLPLTLEAEGIGPEATLNTSEHDIGDVFVNDIREVPHIYIENQGEIEARYQIVPSETPFGSKFQFESLDGVLGTSEHNKSQPLKIKFCSDLMGEFSETFRIRLHGSSEELTLTLKGHVMPPSFKFDKEEINFMEVSYQFPYSEIVRITNTSCVPFTYHIRIPGDNSLMKKEFDIIPKTGYLKPRKVHNIQIDFMPMTVKRYDLVMVVDIEGVGPDMHTLPIKAECFVPKVELVPADSIDFGSVFLRHPYEHELELKNRSRMQAKFEMLPQEEQSTLIAKYIPDREEGFIDGKSSAIVKITMVPQKAGPIRIPMYVKVLGENSQPNMITLHAQCTGPIVQVLTPELDFGKVQVLEEYRLPITLHNKSDIDAEYTAFTKNKNSVFKVLEKNGTLQPEEARQITVVCCADEAMFFNETLHIVIKEGTDVDVAVRARGTGSTAYCEQDISVIDFGTVFSCRNHSRKFTIQNRGRKQQKIKWNRLNARGAFVPVTDTPGKQAIPPEVLRRNPQAANEKQDVFVFAVSPVMITLQPKTQISFEFITNSGVAGEIGETLHCTSIVGNDRRERTVFECQLKGNFVEPFLQFSENNMYFKYVWAKDEPMRSLSRELTVSCVSVLSTHFTLKCAPPFTIDKEEIKLEPGESDSILVEFDPGHKYDRVSGKALQKLQIIHMNHPQRDSVDLTGEVCFPNLKIDNPAIDFGCILNDTSKKVYIKMENSSVLPVIYEWSFVEEVYVDEDRAEASIEETSAGGNINQYFDILPVMGTLMPGEHEIVEFIYHSKAGESHRALAVCSVEGGPEYEVVLSGESSTVNYVLSKYSLDFGDIPFNECSPQEFFIENTGKVPFEFNINLEALNRPGIVEVTPSRGKVGAKEKSKITMKVTPGIPDRIEEAVLIEVAHFDPIIFKIHANGIYPAVFFHLPRPERAKYHEIVERLKTEKGYRFVEANSVYSRIENLSKMGKVFTFDQASIDIESEADRLLACAELTRVTEEHYARFTKKKSIMSADETRGLSTALAEVQSSIVAGIWECNFGNMVLGKDKTRKIRLTNVGQLPTSFIFDVKTLKMNGITVEPAKVQKLGSGESVTISVKFQSNKKTMNFGAIKTSTVIQAKGGLNYQLLFKANLTIPDFSLSSEILDFSSVLVGTMSICKLRIENIREVPCEWSFSTRVAATAVGLAKDWERFQIVPGSGILQPAQKATIDVIFTPTQEKSISQKLEFKIVNNQSNKILTCKGQGVTHQVEFFPGNLILGPVLPYKHDAFSLVEMKNPTDYPIEVYSVDFDQQFREEEEILKAYEGFEGNDDQTVSALNATDSQNRAVKTLHLAPRQPGMPLWKEITVAYANKQKKIQKAKIDKEMEAKLKSENAEEVAEAEAYFKEKREEPEEVIVEERYPDYIPEDMRLNVVVWGPPGCGKTFLAQHLGQKQGRLVLTPDQIVQWHLDQGTALASHITTILSELQEKKEKALQEREKAKKARKKKDEEVPFDESIFKHLPEDLLEGIFSERIQHPDCNAGITIDGLACEYYPGYLFGLRILSKVFKEQGLQLLVVDQGESKDPENPDEEDKLEPLPPDEKANEIYAQEKSLVIRHMEDLVKAKEIIDNKPEPQEQEEEEKQPEEAEGDNEKAKEETQQEEVEKSPIEILAEEYQAIGTREVTEIPIARYKSVLLQSATDVVPEPIVPDPDSLPLPPPQILQIVGKPKNRSKRAPVKAFKIITPIDQRPDTGEKQPESRMVTPKGSMAPSSQQRQRYVQSNSSMFPKLDLSDENLDGSRTRWIIGPKSSTYLLVKFWSPEVGHFENNLNFEIVGSTKHFQLPCVCNCEFPSISNDPRNVFMKRKKNRPPNPPDCYVSRHFIAVENKFEFGPLLVGKTPDKREEDAVKKTNSDVFRISNNSVYPLKIDFAFKSGFSDKKSVFMFEPDTLELEVDETKDLTVWAFPDSIGDFADSVIGLVQGNPKPVIFNVSCQGEKPTAEIEPELILFERILLNQSLTKVLTIKNVCRVPLKWNLLGVETLPEEFSVEKTQGTLKPKESAAVNITFSSIKQQKFSQKLTLEVKDVENIGIKQESKQIALEAEAFDVKISINFFNEKNIVDFKDIKVFEEATHQLSLTNHGIYDVKYYFLMKRRVTREMFNFNPIEGVLNPNQTQQITVTFKCDRERRFDPGKDVSDIKLIALEGGTEEKFEEIPINVAVNAVFSKYSIHPLRNINFGPLQYGDTRVRNFEIRNEGIFDFDFNITEYIDEKLRSAPEAPAATESNAQIDPKSRAPAKKVEKKPPAKGKEVATNDVGPFTISPSSGTVARNSSVVVNLTFNAEGSKLYQKTLAVDVAHRDPKDCPYGIPYDLAGESCIPGVNTWDFDMIFEEQTVVSSLALIHDQKIISSKLFAEEENLFIFGTQIASKQHEGIIEKFKIMNSSKVPANVTFSVKPRTSSKSEGFAFEVNPPKAHIKSHGHEYVKVIFKPTDMMSYGGIFEAVVEHGEPNPKTHKLSFELRGEGTLPTVTQVGAAFAEDGKSIVKFPRTSVNKTTKTEVTLLNGGLIPATVTFEMEFHRSFTLQDTVSATIQPKSRMNIGLSFTPEEAQKYLHEMRMLTLSNPYEIQVLSLQGEGYREDIMFESLPQNQTDKCIFGDCIVGSQQSITFAMKNHTDKVIKFDWADKPHFSFSPSTGHIHPKKVKNITITFSADETVNYQDLDLPCSTVQINLADSKSEWDNSMTYTKLVTEKQYQKIMKRREEEEKRKREEAEAAAKKGGKKPPPPKKKEEKKQELEEESEDDGVPEIEIQEVCKESEHTEIDKSQKVIPFKAAATADYMKYSCEFNEIRFASTLMLTSRSFKFPLRNVSTIAMPYKFKICSATTGRLDAGPYSVAPREGVISPGCDELITVKFLPAEVDELNERLLVCSLQNLAPGMEPLVIELKGRSTRPVCHFELEPSNYREKKAQDMLSIDTSYEIVEFESLGTKVRNTKRFYVVNPTSQAYDFVWEAVEKPGTEYSLKQFRCLTSKGIILSGKKFEMVFEYTPEAVGSHETYWKFRIPSERITQNFLVVGSVVEPVVLLSRGMIDFNQLLIGGKAKEQLRIINQEHIPFSFVFDKNTLKGEEHYGDSLAVTPTTGVVPAQGTFDIEVTFKPKSETRFNYNLAFKVKRKARPLVLNVKGIGYYISHSVLYESSQAPLLKDEPCEMNFGQIFVNESQTRTVQILNTGKFNFDFSWRKPSSLGYLTITPEQATVKTGEAITVEIKYFPITEHKLDTNKLTLAIVSGPKYTFSCKGQARKPGVSFSFLEKNFGPCFVLRTLMPKVENLEIINYDNSAISVETDFEKLPHLDVQLAPGQVLLPTFPNDPDLAKKKLVVPFIFTPRDTTVYNETITFDINNIHKVKVHVKGEGCPIKLELVNQEQETVDFGVLRASNEKSQIVMLANRSKRPVSFTLIENNDNLKSHCVHFTPDHEVSLKPKQTLPIELWFKPLERLHPFSGDLLLKFANGETKKLLEVKGACYGIELKLMEEVVSFGTVVKGSHQSKRVQLLNIGDIPCPFKWDSSKYKDSFTIVPESGVIQANSELYFEVTFHPRKVSPEIKISNVPCIIQEAENLSLTLLGTSIEAPPESTKDLKFETIVRETQALKVQVKNTAQVDWRISPSISTAKESIRHVWTAVSSLDIPAGQTVDYEVSYHPIVMAEENPDQGTLFFPLPDGTAIVYNLIGISKPPRASDTLAKDIKAKMAQVLTLPVKNWLDTSQRFEVRWQIEGEADPAVLIRGASTIDVPGHSTKNYKLNFIAYKLGTTKFRVTFTNPADGEYIFFNVEMKASQQDVQGTAELIGPVREPISRLIMIANPLNTPVVVDRSSITVDNDYILIHPDVLEIPPNSESALEVIYRPLAVTESTSKMLVKSKELGEFNYVLQLQGLPSQSHRNMHFTASLGTELIQAFRFQHFSKKQTQYAIKMERIGGNTPADFRIEKQTVDAPPAGAWEGVEVTIPIIFEPSFLGESRAMLTLTHAEAGEFSCLLYGHSSSPMPQGPFKIPAAKGIGIEFKNPFFETAEFYIKIDNPAFASSAKSPVKLDSKKGMSIQVSYKAVEGKPNTGRMMISYGDMPPWVYYLAGE